jgi:hypothetical protein
MKLFDVSRINLKSLESRSSFLHLKDLIEPGYDPGWSHPDLPPLVSALKKARKELRPRIFFLGGHVIKSGCSKIIMEMLGQGWITHLACNGSVMIHDYELSSVGETSEDVQKHISAGQFGLWHETSVLNDIINATPELGIAASVGMHNCAHGNGYSVLGEAYRWNVPCSVHPLIGADIIHACPNFSGKHTGTASHHDFLGFVESVSHLEGGVFVNVGCAVHGPELYLKALSMSRNVDPDRLPKVFTTAVFDIVNLPSDWRTRVPSWSDPLAYFRPWKTILIRTVNDGGESFYVEGTHNLTIPTLFNALQNTAPSITV